MEKPSSLIPVTIDQCLGADYGSKEPGSSGEAPPEGSPDIDVLIPVHFDDVVCRGVMSEIPPPEQSTPDLGGIAGRDGAQDGLPKRFGKYTLIRKLATGGMAELFLAIQRSVAGFEKLIVIKRILPSMTQDRSFIDMLLHEARIAATLSHPNIVQIFDVGQVDGAYFIAMEHVHGEDIRSIVRGMKKKGVAEFPLEHAVSIVQGMCAGLAYAHEKRDLDGTELRIVHRDISPQNVVVTFTGDVKIVDFGIAKSDAKLMEDTKSGKLKGKVPYMSPEQARGESVDWRSDIFATGVMLFELTTGKRLFKGASEYETLKLICERDYPFPSMVKAGYPPELELIVMKALAKDRDARYQSAREMQGALEEFARGARVATSTIALSTFMQGLFEDKLQTQKEALLQGKQLADIIALQHDADSGEIDGGRPSSTMSTPAAAHTITNAGAHRTSSVGLVAGLMSLFVVLAGAGGGIFWFAKHKKADTGAATTNAPPAEKRGSIEVTSEPPGASIWVNGDLRSEVTPATIASLPLGSAIDVKLTREGYEQARETVTLTAAAPDGKVRSSLRRGSVSLSVDAKPAGLPVTLFVDGKAVTGTDADGLTSGVQHKVIVAAPGYAEQVLTFMGEPMEKKHFDVTLERARKVAGNGKPVPGGTTAPPVPVPVPVAAGNGKLNIGASGGWCNVSVDGAPRGATPVAGLDLPAGPHKVTCVTAEGKSQSATITVTADATARYKFSL
jgi:eukaryotic-like serine/threonine-protein kinase